MKSLIFIALVVVAVSANPFTKLIKQQKAEYENNSCYQNTVKLALDQFKADLQAYKADPTIDLHGKLMSDFKWVASLVHECQLDFNIANALEVVAEGFLITSQCFQDVGGFLLILDTILEDPTDITNDIFAIIFDAIMLTKVKQDCGMLIQFIEQILHPTN